MSGDNKTNTEPEAPVRIEPEDEIERKLLERYLRRKQQDLLKLERAIEERNFTTVRRIGHNLAGSGAAYGLMRVSTIGREIEAASDTHSAADIKAVVAKLRDYISRISLPESP
jgi:HPt (histidine-containing phosphotransfer) domain-containing protein